jgi:hypothetical protein
VTSAVRFDAAKRHSPQYVAGRPGVDSAYLTFTVFVLLVLIVPFKSIYIYYIAVCAVLVGFTLGTPRVQHRIAMVFAALVLFVVAGALLRTIALPDRNPRDYVEAARFVPLILIYTSMYRWRGLRLESLVDAAVIYLMINGFVSVLQFLQVDLFGVSRVVSQVYAADHHTGRALLISRRALGLSPGPGQHGAILFVLGTLVLYGALTLHGRRSFVCLIALIVALGSVLLSQSQTAFLVTLAVMLGMLCYHLLLGEPRSRVLSGIVLGAGLISAGTIFATIAAQFRYLYTLFVYGLGRSSYVIREEKWETLLSSTFEAPGWAPIGWGKDFFGPLSGAMDSDLVYIYCVYGVIVFAAFLGFVIWFLGGTFGRMVSRRTQSGHSVLLFFLVLGGLVFSWPNAFFTSPNILIILALIHASSWWEANTLLLMVPDADEPGGSAIVVSSYAVST